MVRLITLVELAHTLPTKEENPILTADVCECTKFVPVIDNTAEQVDSASLGITLEIQDSSNIMQHPETCSIRWGTDTITGRLHFDCLGIRQETMLSLVQPEAEQVVT